MREDDLPRVEDVQLTLFSANPQELARSIGLNWMSLMQLFRKKFISFNPEKETTLSPSKEAEIKLVVQRFFRTFL